MSKGQETANTKGYPTWTGVCADCGAETTTRGPVPVLPGKYSATFDIQCPNCDQELTMRGKLSERGPR